MPEWNQASLRDFLGALHCWLLGNQIVWPNALWVHGDSSEAELAQHHSTLEG